MPEVFFTVNMSCSSNCAQGLVLYVALLINIREREKNDGFDGIFHIFF